MPGGCRSQGCHGYLLTRLKTRLAQPSKAPSPSSSIGDEFNYKKRLELRTTKLFLENEVQTSREKKHKDNFST